MTDNSNMPAGPFCLIGLFGMITSITLKDATQALQFATAVAAFVAVIMSIYLYRIKIKKEKDQ